MHRSIEHPALKPLKALGEEWGDPDTLRRVADQEAVLRSAHTTVHAHLRRRHEAEGGNWEEDRRAGEARVAAWIRERRQAAKNPDDTG